MTAKNYIPENHRDLNNTGLGIMNI